MILRLYHGRLDPDGPATDTEGNVTDDWGFEGPELSGITAIDFTYGNWMPVFNTHNQAAIAKALTGWDGGNMEYSLTIRTSDRGDLIRIWNGARQRDEYFGDFMLTEG